MDGFFDYRNQLACFFSGDPADPLALDRIQYTFQPSAPSILSFISSMFLHADWEHIIGNLLFLYYFGDNVEEVLGKLKFIIVYLICGSVALLAYWVFNFDSDIPVLGASGAISGILGLYMVFYPHAHIDLIFAHEQRYIVLAHVSTIYAVIAWLLIQLVLASLSNTLGLNIAFSAHIAGLFCGIAIGYLLKSKFNIAASKPERELVFERDKASKIWCPHCGREKYGQDFGSFVCEGCGTRFKVKKSEYFIEPLDNVDLSFDLEQYPKFDKKDYFGEEKSAVIFAQEIDKKVKYSAFINSMEDRIVLTIILSYKGQDRLVESKEFENEGVLAPYLRAKTKFLISDFK